GPRGPGRHERFREHCGGVSSDGDGALRAERAAANGTSWCLLGVAQVDERSSTWFDRKRMSGTSGADGRTLAPGAFSGFSSENFGLRQFSPSTTSVAAYCRYGQSRVRFPNEVVQTGSDTLRQGRPLFSSGDDEALLCCRQLRLMI